MFQVNFIPSLALTEKLLFGSFLYVQSNLSFVLAKQNENPRVPFCTSLRHDVACTSQTEAGQKTIEMFVYTSSDEK